MTTIHFGRVCATVLMGAVLSAMPHLPAKAEEPGGEAGTSAVQGVATAPEAEQPIAEASAEAGASVPVQDCDRLAAAPSDPLSVTAGVRRDQIHPPEAIEACRQAVREFPESARMTFQLGRALETAGDYETAAQWYRKAVDLGSLGAMNNLGYLYMSGDGVPQNSKEALKLFRRAADQGFTFAMVNIGDEYWRGKSVKRNFRITRAWYRKAAEAGNIMAMLRLGRMARYGYGTPLNAWEAASWFRRAALAGDAKGMEILGSFYDTGFGVVQNEETAAKWHEAAAEAENLDATIAAAKAGNLLGMIAAARVLDEGRGIAVDREAATGWFRKAAESGDGKAMYTLAERYRDGVGTEKNPAQAFEWFGRAADEGIVAANYDLALAFDGGHGVGRDPEAAAKLMILELKNGNSLAERQLTTEADVWSEDFRRSLQRLLKGKGVYKGPIDGKFGPGTQRAIKSITPL